MPVYTPLQWYLRQPVRTRPRRVAGYTGAGATGFTSGRGNTKGTARGLAAGSRVGDDEEEKRYEFTLVGRVVVKGGSSSDTYKATVKGKGTKAQIKNAKRLMRRYIKRAAKRMERTFFRLLNRAAPVRTNRGKENIRTRRWAIDARTQAIQWRQRNRDLTFYMYIIDNYGPHIHWVRIDTMLYARPRLSKLLGTQMKAMYRKVLKTAPDYLIIKGV